MMPWGCNKFNHGWCRWVRRSHKRGGSWPGASRAARRAPRNEEDEGDESLAEHLQVQARDGLIPIEAFAVANEDDLVLIN
jgi:hypothetical protein